MQQLGGQPGPRPPGSADTLTLQLPDVERRLAGVRLRQEVGIPAELLDFSWTAGIWSVTVPRPAVDRMEYLLELAHHDGASEVVPDPANPRRARGAFGDRSVVELAGYRRPGWLDVAAEAGRRKALTIAARSMAADVHVTLWSPAGVDDRTELPLLVAHDGPEYDDLASLTTYLSVLVADGRLPPLRAALLAPGERDDWYCANNAYASALSLAVLPRLRLAAPTTRVIGVGASLGALAMLHAQRRYAAAFDALFLQSGSFFHPTHDGHERRFPHYDRVVRAVDGVLRGYPHRNPVPAVLTCGAVEENLANNRIMGRALAAQGYDAVLHEVRDAHNYVAWRDALDPHLTGLLLGVACGTFR